MKPMSNIRNAGQLREEVTKTGITSFPILDLVLSNRTPRTVGEADRTQVRRSFGIHPSQTRENSTHTVYRQPILTAKLDTPRPAEWSFYLHKNVHDLRSYHRLSRGIPLPLVKAQLRQSCSCRQVDAGPLSEKTIQDDSRL